MQMSPLQLQNILCEVWVEIWTVTKLKLPLLWIYSFLRGVMYQWEIWEGRGVGGRIRKDVLYECCFLHLVKKIILRFKVSNSKQNKKVISNSLLFSHWSAWSYKHGCMFAYIIWTHSWRCNPHKFNSVSKYWMLMQSHNHCDYPANWLVYW